ncbi:MAG: aldo/keto reductase, partial [Clostridiales bacterium]|nr:aldo/keto reductase [Clostridiales bacterium]
MRTVILGSTGIPATATSFGALPIQRVPTDDAVAILRAARDAGINYFDTARAYSDSEEKLGRAFGGDWRGAYIATKSGAKDAAGLRRDLETSLRLLKAERIDVYQFHNPPFVPLPGGADGLYDAAAAARRAGMIGHIAITQHSLDRAFEAVESGLYEVLQFPLNHLSGERELELLRLCREKNVGFVAMKALSGGLVTDARLPFAFFMGHDNAVPIWGIQRMAELDQFIELEKRPPTLDDAMLQAIEADKRALSGAFCRGCGYCLPCPVGIPIHNANRMTQLLTRSPQAQ